MSVLGYLAILFAVAFLLLLMAYFQQQRVNNEALDSAKKSASAVETIQNTMEENKALTEQVDTLTQERDKALADAKAAQTDAQTAQAQTQALKQLNELRGLYNQEHFKAARSLLEAWETTAPGELEKTLTAISSGMTQEERDAYDPLDAYQKLIKWLS